MRKVTSGLFMSLDGVVQAPNEWQPAFDDEMGAAMGELMDGQDAMLMGRRTYQEWAGYWPTSTDEPFASYINGTTKYVASTTLAPDLAWSNSELISGPVPDFVQRLKQTDGGKIGIGGSPTLVRSLLGAGILDELSLFISPVVVGGGKARLFPEDMSGFGLSLESARPTSSGHLIATYHEV